MTWRPMATAPKRGVIIARRNPEDVGSRGRRTWWGKASHINWFGWCYGRCEDVEVWYPDEWRPLPKEKPQ